MLAFLSLASLARPASTDTCQRSDYSGDSSPISLTDLSFVGCRSDTSEYPLNGGAIFIHNDNSELDVTNCRFIDCYSYAAGGAVHFTGLSATLTRCQAIECRATWEAGFRLELSNPATGILVVRECLAMSGSSNGHTVFLKIGNPKGPTSQVVQSLNSTSNFGNSGGSGLIVTRHYSLSLSFCYFSHNSIWNTVSIGDPSVPNPIYRCLTFVNNTASASAIATTSSCVFSDCLFAGNAIGLLVGAVQDEQQQFADSPCWITLVRCVFDKRESATTLQIILSSESCKIQSDLDPEADLPYCPRFAAGSPNPTRSPSPVCALYHSTGGRFSTFSSDEFCYTFSGCEFARLGGGSVTHGGAIYCDYTGIVMNLLDCEFHECKAGTGGGALWFTHGAACHFFGFAGRECSAQWESFCQVLISQGDCMEVSLNESQGLGGVASLGNSFCIKYGESALGSAAVQFLNCSGNDAPVGSGIVVDPHGVLLFQFCRFLSNFAGNILLFGGSTSGAESYRCIDFFNNTAGTNAAITVQLDCAFCDSFFSLTQIDAGGTFIRSDINHTTFSVRFVRCTFDTDNLPSQSVNVKEEFCSIRDRPGSLEMQECGVFTDPPPSPLRTPNQCYRYTCYDDNPQCHPKIDITNSFFAGCRGLDDDGNDADGGAVHIHRGGTVFNLISAEFRDCSVGGDKSGGAVFFFGESLIVSGFVGSSCSARAEAFCSLKIASAATGVIQLNDSSAFNGACASNGFCTEYSAYDSGSVEVLDGLNFTANYADVMASAIWIGNHFALQLHFCRFILNAPRNVLAIRGTNAPDSVVCLEFIDNRVTTVDSAVHGLLNIMESFTFVGCVFAENKFDFLVGGASNSELTLLRCIFDVGDIYDQAFSADGVLVEAQSCTIQSSGPISIDPAECPLEVSPSSSSEMRPQEPTSSASQEVDVDRSRSPALIPPPSMSRSPDRIPLPSVSKSLDALPAPSISKSPDPVPLPSITKSADPIPLPSITKSADPVPLPSITKSADPVPLPSITKSADAIPLPSISKSLDDDSIGPGPGPGSPSHDDNAGTAIGSSVTVEESDIPPAPATPQETKPLYVPGGPGEDGKSRSDSATVVWASVGTALGVLVAVGAAVFAVRFVIKKRSDSHDEGEQTTEAALMGVEYEGTFVGGEYINPVTATVGSDYFMTADGFTVLPE